MEYLKQFGLALLIALVAREIIGCLNGFSCWLVRTAARKLPSQERERFIEENLAVLDEIEGPLYKLYNALGCFSAAASIIKEHAIASDNRNAASARKLSVRLLAIALLAPVIWNIYTTFRGLSDFFDLPTHPSINPGQFAFGIVVTVIVSGFVIASRVIWNSSDGALFPLLKAASVVCVAIDVAASWFGTKHVISFNYDDPAKAFGLALVVAVVVLSMIGLSKLLFDGDNGDKALLS
jgi:hypothetical protein